MYRLIFIIILLRLLGCKDKASQEGQPENNSSESTAAEAAGTYFSELKNVLEADSANFLGVPLYGPIFLVDHDSQIF